MDYNIKKNIQTYKEIITLGAYQKVQIVTKILLKKINPTLQIKIIENTTVEDILEKIRLSLENNHCQMDRKMDITQKCSTGKI
jgi:hypothetical protein